MVLNKYPHFFIIAQDRLTRMHILDLQRHQYASIYITTTNADHQVSLFTTLLMVFFNKHEQDAGPAMPLCPLSLTDHRIRPLFALSDVMYI